MTTAVYDEPKQLPDGSNHQQLRVSGRFYEPYDLLRYPLDRQRIALYLEDSTRTIDEVVYVADRTSNGLYANIVVPGWNLAGPASQSLIHEYLSDFGDTSLGAAGSKLSSLVYSLTIVRNLSFFSWKLLFPLVVVLLTNWLALLLRPTWTELRTGMLATALLTDLFLQLSYSANLPELSYLVLMDKIYVVAYAMIIATLIQIIWSNHRVKQDAAAGVARVRRLDRVSALTQILVFTAVVAALVITR